jgi:hypothetical protein
MQAAFEESDKCRLFDAALCVWSVSMGIRGTDGEA